MFFKNTNLKGEKVMFYLRRKMIFLGIGIMLLFTWFIPVHAKKTFDDASATLGTVAQKTGIEETNVSAAAGNAAKFAFSAVGILFFILMVYAGINWMTARENQEKATKARNTIIAAAIGLV